MKVLVTGGSGLLGSALVGALASRGHSVVATYNTHEPRGGAGVKWVKLDITKGYLPEDLVWKERPQAIVHCAAYTDVDGCELDKARAWAVNVEGTRSVVRAARAVNAYLVYVSTDYVFDGERGMYTERDTPCPVNYYGLTKLVGEEIVRSSDVLYAIVRPSAIYGLWGSKKSFAEYVAEKLVRGEEVKALVDQYVSPTFSVFLAESIAKILEVKVLGLLHVAGDRMSRYEFALKLAEALDASKSLVKEARMSEMKGWVARRPRDSSLDTSKARELLGEFHDSSKAIGIFASEFLRRMGGQGGSKERSGASSSWSEAR